MTEGLRVQEITDEFVLEHTVPVEEAESFTHLGMDDAYHPAGGYWFPADRKWGDRPGWVSQKYNLPHGEVIQYPCDDREPEVRGEDELPDWVVNRVITDGDRR